MGPDDLVIGVISGGSSALMSCPIKGISLEDEIQATDVLLKSGAGIFEINAIRRHISQLNGGMLAKRIQARGAELIGVALMTLHGYRPQTTLLYQIRTITVRLSGRTLQRLKKLEG